MSKLSPREQQARKAAQENQSAHLLVTGFGILLMFAGLIWSVEIKDFSALIVPGILGVGLTAWGLLQAWLEGEGDVPPWYVTFFIW